MPRYWYKASSDPRYSNLPVGKFGWILFIAKLSAMLVGTLMVCTQIKPDAFPFWLNQPALGGTLLAASTLLLIYALLKKTDYSKS